MKKEKDNSVFSTSISLSNYDRQVLERLTSSKNVTRAVRALVHMANLVYAENEYELRGMFEPTEWEYMANVLRDIDIEDFARVSNSALLASILVQPTYGMMAEFFRIDQMDFSRRIRQLSASHTFAVWWRIRQHWANPDEQTMEEFSKW
jgi:hypothetical protein